MVSVIMPAYNMERFIGKAIRSVMDQTYRDWELLVIDDGSKDSTCDIVARLAAEDARIQLIRNEKNMGVARTRNRGFDLCRGDYIALLDSDDVWHPEKLEKQLARMQQTGADLSYCAYALVDENGERVKADYLVPDSIDFEGLLKENVIGCSTVMLTVEVTAAHRFNEDFYHEDYVLWLELLRAGKKAAGCREVLVDWRYLQNSRSFNKVQAAKNRWKIYREYLKLPLLKCVAAFGAYATLSLRKYIRKAN